MVSDTDVPFKKLALYLIPLVLLSFTLEPSLTWAEELVPQDALGWARAEFLLQQKQYELALDEYGELPKLTQEDPLFQRHVELALAALYRQQRPLRTHAQVLKPRFSFSSRVTNRRYDADNGSDQSWDNRGFQVNQHLEGQGGIKEDLNYRLVLDLDGFKDGHNDLRYRTVLADLFRGPSHLAFGDTATYTSPYFLRGSRLRGVNALLIGPTNEFQMVAGAYPVWLESRDAYVYPRWVWGIRDKVKLLEDKFRLGANLVQTRDSEKIRTLDGANPQARVDPVFRPRDNIVLSLDQEVKIIPEVWFLKAAQSYSTTDDNLLQDRFGDTTKLKDFAFQVESFLIQPFFRWRGQYERTGPDFRLLTDLPQGAVTAPKDVRADTQRIVQSLDLAPLGPLDLDLEASWIRNDLDDDQSIEHTRQSWYTANLGIRTPEKWPRPRLRYTLSDTVSVPGSTTRPSETRTWDLLGEIHKGIELTDVTLFSHYTAEHPLKEEGTFDEEESWATGIRLARPFGERVMAHSRYRHEFFDELVDEIREDGIRHEANLGGSIRLWSTANLGLNYTFQHGKVVRPGGTRLTHAEVHAGTANFTWPYTRFSPDKREKLTILPGLVYHLTEFRDDLQKRPLISGRLGLGYNVYPDWKLELLGEYRYDHDEDRTSVRTESSRFWALLSGRL